MPPENIDNFGDEKQQGLNQGQGSVAQDGLILDAKFDGIVVDENDRLLEQQAKAGYHFDVNDPRREELLE